MKFSFALNLAIALACTVCAPAMARDTESATLHEHLQLLTNRYGVSNAAVAVVRQRELQAVEQIPGTEESVFEAASLSKPVFAYAVLKLVQEGKMELDAPILKYLPQGYAHRHFAHLANSPIDQVTDPKLSEVTVRMALNHTSGLPNWASGPLAIKGRPGGTWQYSGEGFVLLQRAVETVTGENLADYMKRTVFTPLGMTHSAYTRQKELETLIAPGSDYYGTTLKPARFREPVAAFSLYTSAADYGRFIVALLKDERSLRQIVESPVLVNSKLGLSWGLGWGIERSQGDVFLWHWGNNPGYRAFVMASPRSGDAFVMFTNSEKGLALAKPLGDDILPGTHPVYRYHLLRDGLANLMCETLDVCL